MRLVLTGATGFIGSRLLEMLLASGIDAIPVVRDTSHPLVARSEHWEKTPSRWINAAEVGAFLATERPDAVVHLATHYLKSHTTADIQDLLAANVDFGVRLLDAIDTSRTRLLYTSSFFQYFQGQSNPISLYAATKTAFNVFVDYYRQLGLRANEVVLYDSFGPGDTRDKLIPLLIRAAQSGEAVSLGPAEQLTNLSYVDDICRGILHQLSSEADGTHAIRAQSPVTVGEIVEAIGKLAGHSLSATFSDGIPNNKLVLQSGDWPTPDGWSPEVNLSAGLAKCFEPVPGLQID